MYGAMEWYRTAQKAGLHPIIGVEAYLAEGSARAKERKSYHLLLLARNMTGYKNLLKLASAAQLEGFYYKPRIDKETLAAHAEGLICTTGCLAAEIPRLLTEDRQPEKARREIGWYYEVFGPQNFFFELQDHSLPELRELNKALAELQPHFNARFVATNDVHYVLPDEGGTMWVDGYSIPKGAQNVEAAYKFLDYLLRPEVAAKTTQLTQTANTVEKSKELLPPELVQNAAVYPSADKLAEADFILDLGDATKYYQDGWTKVKAAE